MIDQNPFEFSEEFLRTDPLWVSMRDVVATVREVDASYVVPEARFKEELEAESLDAIEIAEGVEAAFEIKVPDEVLNDIHTVADLYFTIRDLKAEQEDS